MNQPKIQQLEEEIRKSYLNNPDELVRVFWNIHIETVIREAKGMAEKYGADLEIVWLSAILHDIGQFEDLKIHEEIGAEKSRIILKEKSFSEEILEKVSQTIITHRVNKHQPETLEQKILASADAVSHFKAPHYIWMARASKKDLKGLFEKIHEKLDRDYNQKIFFEDEKKMVEEQYKMLKNWFNFKID